MTPVRLECAAPRSTVCSMKAQSIGTIVNQSALSCYRTAHHIDMAEILLKAIIKPFKLYKMDRSNSVNQEQPSSEGTV